MAKSSLCLLMLSLVLSVLSYNSAFAGGTSSMWKGKKTWCVAKPSTSVAQLQANLNFACTELECTNFFCESCICYSPNTLLNHASIAMNLYYQTAGKHKWNCYFNNSGLIVINDPSYDNCPYVYAEP